MNKEEKQRTIQQNRALHKLFLEIARKLNQAGLDMRKVLKPGIEIPWTMEMVKNHLWRPVQETYLEKQSTTELNTKDLDAIYEILNRFLGEKGIHVPFPSIEAQREEELLKNN